MDRPWNIYRWEPGEGSPHRLAQGFGDPLGLDITPNGKWAVLATKNGGKEGVWGIDVESGKTVKLADGKPKGVSISPDGKRAVVEFSPDTGDLDYDMVHEQLRIIDLTPLV
jgi:Tol biopolymer transport system component